MRTSLRALFAAVIFSVPIASFAGVFVSVAIAPPPLLVYEQPPCPSPGYLWTPGYWAYDYDFDDYYWVPGTWVLAPRPDFFWTPGYWAWIDAYYVWHPGYWGPHVGYYGGIDYGYGYGGYGYDGGRWEHGAFYYNTAVNNVHGNEIHNTYNTTVINNVTVNRVSYNGGSGGTDARPRREDEDAAREHHVQATDWQTRHEHAARADRSQFASGDHDHPVVAATPRPAAFSEHGVVRAEAPQWRHDARADRDQNRGADRNALAQPSMRERSNVAPRADRGDSASPAGAADAGRPLQGERPQLPRHRDRSSGVVPDSRPVPEMAPREMSPRQGDPAERPRLDERTAPVQRRSPQRYEPTEPPQHYRRPDGAPRPEATERPNLESRQMPREALPQRAPMERPQAEHPAMPQHGPSPREPRGEDHRGEHRDAPG